MVLILILLDVSLGVGDNIIDRQQTSRVLILILLDVSLGAALSAFLWNFLAMS